METWQGLCWPTFQRIDPRSIERRTSRLDLPHNVVRFPARIASTSSAEKLRSARRAATTSSSFNDHVSPGSASALGTSVAACRAATAHPRARDPLAALSSACGAYRSVDVAQHDLVPDLHLRRIGRGP